MFWGFFFQCYTLLRSIKPLSFKYANEKCQSVRGSLVSISDQVEQGEACIYSHFLFSLWKLEIHFYVWYILKMCCRVDNNISSVCACVCVLDFIITLVPSMGNVDRMWIGLKLMHDKPEWIDQSPVNYVNFNPLLVGMHRSMKMNVSSPPNWWRLHHSIITHPSVCFEFEFGLLLILKHLFIIRDKPTI